MTKVRMTRCGGGWAGFARFTSRAAGWSYDALSVLAVARSATQGGALLCPGLRNVGPLGLRVKAAGLTLVNTD